MFGSYRAVWIRQVVGETLLARAGGDDANYGSAKVAGFDFDGTLVNTKHNSPFARDENDYKLFNEMVEPKLKKLHEQNYRFAPFMCSFLSTNTQIPTAFCPLLYR